MVKIIDKAKDIMVDFYCYNVSITTNAKMLLPDIYINYGSHYFEVGIAFWYWRMAVGARLIKEQDEDK